jgi:site-specific DNA recombinase
MTTKGLHLDAYVRVSKVGGRAGESFISPDVQADEIKRWAEANGAHVTWHEPELDVSGGTMDRPIFGAIMERIRTGQTQGIIVAKLDRFARSLVGALDTLHELDEHGAVLVCTRDNIDLSTSTGRAFMRILLVFAELEKERIAENFGDATKRAIERGVFIANGAPFGYDRQDGKLKLGELAPIVREVFLRRGAGEGPTALAALLNERAPLPNDNQWTTQRVWRLLQTRAYQGHVYYGDRVNTSAHEPIVSEVEWERAQLTKAPSAARTSAPALLSGLVRCSACRYALAPSRAGSDRLYRCRKQHASGACPAPAQIRQSRLDAFVEERFLEAMRDRAIVATNATSDTSTLSDSLQALDTELREFAADTTAREILGSDRYHEALSARKAKVDTARAELQDAMATSAVGQVDIDGYADLGIADKRVVLASAIDAIVVARANRDTPLDERVRILWTGEGPKDLPRRRHDNGPIRGFEG